MDESRSLSKPPTSRSPIAPLGTTPTKRQRGFGTVVADNGIGEMPNAMLLSSGSESEDILMRGTDMEQENQQSSLPESSKPTPRRRGRPPKTSTTPGNTPTPRAPRQNPSQNPSNLSPSDDTTPRKQTFGADRSARRKSTRALIERVVGDDSDDDILAREIYESSEGEADGEETGAAATGDESSRTDYPSAATTKQKRSRRRAKSPTPPRDLPPHEMYFFQNKPGRPKTSDNTLASLNLLTHEEYFEIAARHQDPHQAEIDYLESLHAESFDQWMFELSQGFSVCLYGYGSKKNLLLNFARKVHAARADHGKIVIVNGYTPTTTMREILTTVSVAVDPTKKIPTSQPTTMVQAILAHLATTTMTLTLIVNSIDAPPLRKPSHQSILAQLASHPQVHLIASTDTPDFPLLWDIGLRNSFNFAFHDCTTFAPLSIELDVVDDVHELLGRKARRVNGREGVAFVLKSLPENAKNLFQLIVGEVLMAMEEEGSGEEDAGVEYRMIYNKAVEEFICSSEMAFRTLLKEFHDHQIITSRKDAIGTELLSVPFKKEELEDILEDLMA